MAEHNLDPDHELAVCVVCELGEGALTTECPGFPAGQYSDLTCGGRLDFQRGRWVREKNPTNQMWDRWGYQYPRDPNEIEKVLIEKEQRRLDSLEFPEDIY